MNKNKCGFMWLHILNCFCISIAVDQSWKQRHMFMKEFIKYLTEIKYWRLKHTKEKSNQICSQKKAKKIIIIIKLYCWGTYIKCFTHWHFITVKNKQTNKNGQVQQKGFVDSKSGRSQYWVNIAATVAGAVHITYMSHQWQYKKQEETFCCFYTHSHQ